MAYTLGTTIRSTFSTFSDPDRTTPADPTTVQVTELAPDGTSTVYTWALGQVTRDSLGVFHHDFTGSLEGHYELYWQAAGAVVASFTDSFDVRPAYRNLISVQDVRQRLNKTLTVDDDEIRDMIDSALVDYSEHVGPLPGSRTESFWGAGRDKLILSSPYASEITAAVYSDGTTITVTDLEVEHGIVSWGFDTAGRFALDRKVSVTYTVGGLPANHRETIVADVAGYFEATQGGTSSNAASFPGEGFSEAPYRTTPMVLFPRIRALAPVRVG